MAVLMVVPALVGLAGALAVRRWCPDIARGFAVRGLPLVALGLVVETIRYLVLPDDAHAALGAGRAFAVADIAIVVAVLFLNRPAVAGRATAAVVALVGLGVACNATAVVIAGAMPYSAAAARAAGLPADEIEGHLLGYVHADTVPAPAALLGDVLPLPPLMKVLSVGDLLMFIGLVVVVALVFGRTLVTSQDDLPVSAHPHAEERR